MRVIVVICLVAVGLVVGCSCHKEHDPIVATPKPSISFLSIDSVGMTSASVSFGVKNSKENSIYLDGASKKVAGNSYEATGLKPNSEHTIKLVARNGDLTDSREASFTTAKTSLKVDSLKVGKITAKSITLNFASSSDVNITEQTLTNQNTGEQFNVLGKKTFEVTNLEPNTKYTFELQVKDNSGNLKKQSVQVTTLKKNSDWFGGITVTYGKKFAIDGNAVSSELTIKITNLSSATKTLKSLTANFGDNGRAVKMLRYFDDATGKWVVLPAGGEKGEITFKNLTLKPGVNTLTTYFALKPQVGVSNGSALNFQFVSLDDGEQGGYPHDGTFPSAVDVGTVNANVQPTEIVDYGDKGITILTEYGNTGVPPRSTVTREIFFDFVIHLSGPEGARLYSLHLKNPYASFTGIAYTPNTWVFMDVPTTPDPNNIYLDYTWGTGNKDISFIFPKGENGKAYTDTQTPNRYDIGVDYKNEGSQVFNSNDYTPGEIGYQLTSKYDVVILNSDDQVIDLSDVTVYKLNKVYLTD